MNQILLIMKKIGLLLLVAVVAFSSCKKKKDKVNSSYLGTYIGLYDITTSIGEVDDSVQKAIIRNGSNAKELKTAVGMVFILDEDGSGSFTVKPDVVTDMMADTSGNYMKTVSGSGKFEGSHLTFDAKLV